MRPRPTTNGTGSEVTLVAEGCDVQGDVRFSGELFINGALKGRIEEQPNSGAKLSIGEQGSVEGEIHVANVLVAGKVIGDIHSDTHVTLSAKSQVSGNIHYQVLEMVAGAKLSGRVVHLDDVEAQASASDEANASPPDEQPAEQNVSSQVTRIS